MADTYIKVIDGNRILLDHKAAAAANEGLYVNGIMVAGAQGVNITAASVAHALNATFSDTEVEAALDALGTKLNLVIAAMKLTGSIASA